MRDAGVSLLFLSGNAVCWVTPLPRRQRRPPQPDHVPRRPLRRRQRLRRAPREAARAVPRARAGRGLADRRAQRRAGQRRRGLDRGRSRITGFSRDGHEAGRRDPRPRRLGVPRRPGRRSPASRSSPRGRPGSAAWPRSSGRRRSIPARRGTSSSTPRRSSGPRGFRSPPGHTLPWSHWSRPHGPDDRVQRITRNVLERAIGRKAAAEPTPAEPIAWQPYFLGFAVGGACGVALGAWPLARVHFKARSQTGSRSTLMTHTLL